MSRFFLEQESFNILPGIYATSPGNEQMKAGNEPSRRELSCPHLRLPIDPLEYKCDRDKTLVDDTRMLYLILDQTPADHWNTAADYNTIPAD